MRSKPNSGQFRSHIARTTDRGRRTPTASVDGNRQIVVTAPKKSKISVRIARDLDFSAQAQLPGMKGHMMKDAGFCPRERRRDGREWLTGLAVALVLGTLLVGCGPTATASSTKSTSGQRPPAPTPVRNAAAPGQEAPAPDSGTPTLTMPGELPSKGSPDAKLVMFEFSGFH